MKLLPLAAAALLLLAGCLGASTSGSSSTTRDPTHGGATSYPEMRYTPPGDPMPDGAGHDHADPAQHKFLWNYAFSAHDSLLENAADAAGLHALDIQNGWLFGAMYGSHAASVDGGVQIWDVHTDPAHPKEMGRWVIPGSVGGDRSLGATPDGDYVVVGSEYLDCLGQVNPSGAVLTAYLLDTRNKMVPVVADTLLASGGTLGDPTNNRLHSSTHSVFVHRIKGIDYAFIFGDIYKIDRESPTGSAKLMPVGTVSTGHDIYVRDTPWNTTWALSANGGNGLVIFDVTDPSAPFEIGTWDRSDHANASYYFHTSDVAFVGDQTLVVLSSEDFVPSATVVPGPGGEKAPGIASPFWVVDGNPLRGIKRGENATVLSEIGAWHNPWNVTAMNIHFSLHNERFHDGGLLTFASYHAGFFQFDMRNPGFWANPSLIAYGAYADGTPPATVDPFESVIESKVCGLDVTIDAPEFFDPAIGPNGVLYFADVFMGLYTFVPTASHPVYGASRTVEYTGLDTPGL